MESSSSSSDSPPPESRKGRKRLRCVDQWTRNRRKARKDSGKSYKTCSGERRGRKQPPLALRCRCQHHCASRLSLAERKRIFDDFYELGDSDAQNKYLFGLLERSSPKQRRLRGTSGQPRSNTYCYFVRISSGDRLKVCKQAFCLLHAIGKRRVEVLCEKLTSGVLMSRDSRGRHSTRPRNIPEDLRVQVREHISSFPSQESHYSRSNNRSRLYLPENLSIARMYRLYIQKYEPDASETPQVKEWLYRKIFNEEYNIGFGYPRSDTCEKCDSLKVAIDEAKTDEQRKPLQVELANHHEEAARGYQSLHADSERSKSDASLAVITFDLQQNLPVPTLTHGPMFYMRQLWVHNLGIHDCRSNTAVMSMWDETVAGRGSNEVISCLKEYIAKLPSHITQLTCYSDSCFGQNKNFHLLELPDLSEAIFPNRSQVSCTWAYLPPKRS